MPYLVLPSRRIRTDGLRAVGSNQTLAFLGGGSCRLKKLSFYNGKGIEAFAYMAGLPDQIPW